MPKTDLFTQKLRSQMKERSLSPLELMYRAQKDCADRGFDFQSPHAVLEKLEEEVEEVREALIENHSREELLQEIGDVFFSLVNLCRHLDASPEEILASNAEKYMQRCEYIENQLKKANKNWGDITDPEIRVLWKEAKGALGTTAEQVQ